MRKFLHFPKAKPIFSQISLFNFPHKNFPSSAKFQDEVVALVDINDNEIGFMFRGLRYNNLVINRLSSVFIVNTSGRFYVQKRKSTKSWCPNHYDLTFGGLVRYGETYEENAYRELKEELNIDGVHLEPIFKTLFDDPPSNSKTWCQVFLAIYNGSIKPQVEEVDSVSLRSTEEVERMLKKGEKFTPDSLFVYEKLIKSKLLDKYISGF